MSSLNIEFDREVSKEEMKEIMNILNNTGKFKVLSVVKDENNMLKTPEQVYIVENKLIDKHRLNLSESFSPRIRNSNSDFESLTYTSFYDHFEI